MQQKHMHTGHRLRLKAKFERVGLDGFEDHEVLEYLLTFAIPQKDVNPLAHNLIDHFGSLNGVFDANPIELMRVDGVGQHTASLITLVPKLAKRYLDNPAKAKRYSLIRYADREKFFVPKFVGETEECMYAAFLNNNWEVLNCSMVCKGSIDTVKLEVRSLLDVAMRLRATMVILAHNHLSNPNPSTADVVTTGYIADKLATCGISLVDHLIVCGDGAISLSVTGQMKHVR